MEELDKRRINKDKGRADRSTGIKRRSLAIFLACVTFIVIAMARQSNILTADHIPDFAQRIELATGKNYHSITTQKRTDEPRQVSSDSREESLDLLFPERFDMPFVVAGNGVQVTMRNLGVSPSRLQVVLDPSSGDGKGEFIYQAVYPHTDSRHRVEQGRSEEFLYLHNELAPTTFEYELTQIEGADLVSLQGGAIIFSRGGVPNLQIEAPWVIDATGRRSEDAVRWKLEPADQQGRRRLQLSLDPTGLQYPLTVDPSWSVAAAMTVARGNPRSIRLSDGKIMVTGSGTSVQLYDPATGVWSATGSLNTGRTLESLTLLSDGRVLVAGGSSSGATLTSCEIYNPSTGTWSLTGSLNHNRLDHRAVLLTDGRVLVIGGYNWPVVGSLLEYPVMVEIYDPVAGTWSSPGTTTPRIYHQVVLLNDGKVLVVGGYNDTTGATTTPQIYDPATNVWSNAGTIHNTMDPSATLLTDGKVLVTGGRTSGASGIDSAIRTSIIYDPVAGTWSNTGQLNNKRAAHTATRLLNGNVLVTGGESPVNTSLSTTEIYDPIAGTWSSAGSMSTPRRFHAASLLSYGAVLIMGGTNGSSTQLTSVELYGDPNQTPTITAASGLTRMAGASGSNSTIATVTDAETASGSLTVTVTTANPANGVTISNIANSSGTITADIVAATGATSAIFTLQVSDGTATATATLNVAVTGNQAPTITAASGLTRMAGASGGNSTIATVTDAETASGSLTVTVTTANPANGVTISNIANSSGTITADIVAATGASNAIFTLQVSDGTATATATLNVTVSGNQAPTISAASGLTRTAGASGGNSTIATVTDAETASGSLTVTVTTTNPANGVTISNIVNSSGTITADIVAAKGASNASFTLQVSDGTATATARLNVAVTSSPPVTFDNNPPINPQDGQADFRPGSVVVLTQTLSNNTSTPVQVTFIGTLPSGLTLSPGACTATLGTCAVSSLMATNDSQENINLQSDLNSVASNSTFTWTGTIPGNGSVTIRFEVQVSATASAGNQYLITSTINGLPGPSFTIKLSAASSGPGESAGLVLGQVAGQKPGSFLIYNLYSSGFDTTRNDSRITITNTSPRLKSYVHFFFIDGSNCSVADMTVTLTPNQTASFLASDFDPGVTGYLIAVATDADGCPVIQNDLIGESFVKFESGHRAVLPALGVAALGLGGPMCTPNQTMTTLSFDGLSYNPLPRTLAVSGLPSIANGYSTMLVVNRVGGDLGTGAARLGSLFGLLYDDQEASQSFTLTGNVCQLRGVLGNNYPRTSPRYTTVIPAGRSGWMKFWSAEDQAITGAVIQEAQDRLAGGHNLHHLTTTSSATLTIPVIPAW